MLCAILGEVSHDADAVLVVAQQWACMGISRIAVNESISLR